MARRRARRAAPNRFAAQASLETDVRFAPEVSALRTLMREAEGSFAQSLELEEGAARGIRSAIQRVRPEVEKQYAQSLGDFEAASTMVKSDLAKLGSAADPYKAATMRDHAGAVRRLQSGLAGAVRDLADRDVRAQEGQAWGIRKAKDEYAGAKAKIGGRLQELGQETGTFAAARIGSLNEAQRGRDATARGQRRTAATARAGQRQTAATARAGQAETRRHNAATERTAAAAERRQAREAREGGGASNFTPTQVRASRSAFRRAAGMVRALGVGRGGGKEAIFFLTQKKNVDPLMAHAAAQHVIYGGVEPDWARKVRLEYGFTPKVNRRPRRG